MQHINQDHISHLHATQAGPRLLHLGPGHTQISAKPVLLHLLQRLLLEGLWL
jgi:hypothetical protein